MKKLLMMIGAAAVAVGAMLPMTAMAANYWWTGKESRSYGDANNWAVDNAGSEVATKVPGNDAAYFVGTAFNSRFMGDGYIVEFDRVYTNSWNYYFSTAGAKVTFRGKTSDCGLTYYRGDYRNIRWRIGEASDGSLRLENGTFTHAYTNFVIGVNSTTVANRRFGHLEIADGATLNIPSDAGWCDGMLIDNGSVLVDGATLASGKDINVGTIATSLSYGSFGAFTNINGTVSANILRVGRKNATAEYIQKGGNLTTEGDILIAESYTRGSAYFEVDGGTVTAGGAITNKSIYVGHNGYSESSAHLVVKGDSEVNCQNLIIGYKAPGIADIEGGIVRCGNECRLSSTVSSDADDALEHPRLNLLGGVLVTSRVKCESTNSYSTVFFNGGTLRERQDNDTILKASDRMDIKVGANGGTIDMAGFTTTVSEDIETGVDEGTDGGMKYVGGGTANITGAISYTGPTTVELGTLVKVTDRANIFGEGKGGLRCSLPNPKPEGNEYITVLTMTGEDDFTASDLTKCAAAEGAGGISFRISGDGKSIMAKRSNGLIISFH